MIRVNTLIFLSKRYSISHEKTIIISLYSDINFQYNDAITYTSVIGTY